MSKFSLAWTDEKTEKAQELWAKGYSASQISRELNSMSGLPLSRNAVIGKLNRLGCKNPATKKLRIRNYEPRLPKQKIIPIKTDLPKPEPTGPLNDFPAVGLCRNIDDDPKNDWRCCGAPGMKRKVGKEIKTLVYCEYHWAINHRPAKSK